MKLYTLAVAATRDSDGGPAIRTFPAIALAESEREAHAEGMAGAHQHLPAADGWRDHQVVLYAIPPHLILNSHVLTWEARPVAADP